MSARERHTGLTAVKDIAVAILLFLTAIALLAWASGNAPIQQQRRRLD